MRTASAMNHPRLLLKEIAELPLPGPVSIMNLCSDQERAIGVSRLRQALPDRVNLVAGPGCVASICPQADVFQAIQLAVRHPVILYYFYLLLLSIALVLGVTMGHTIYFLYSFVYLFFFSLRSSCLCYEIKKRYHS